MKHLLLGYCMVCLLGGFMLTPSTAHAACTTDTQLSLLNNGSANHIVGGTVNNPSINPGDGSIAGQIYTGGNPFNPNNVAGTANLTGTADCSAEFNAVNDRIDNQAAVAAALATPAWLEHDENFSLTGGVGFNDESAALGLKGIARLDNTFSAFGGAAVSTDGDEWAANAGIRAGW